MIPPNDPLPAARAAQAAQPVRFAAAAAAAPPSTQLRSAPWSWRNLLRHGAQVALANVVIAGVLTMLHGHSFVTSLIYSQTIGLLIWLTVEFGRLLVPRDAIDGWPRGWILVGLVGVACVVGYGAGTTAVDMLFNFSSWRLDAQHPRAIVGDLVLTLIFATIIAGAFYSHARAQSHRAQVAAVAHEATLARLVLLQSQLEPHMLFNTLANLRVLIAADPARAQAMLDRLIDFLRATLNASRVAEHALRDEFARVDDYLALMQVRMGERLRVRTLLPPELADIAVPPLLLQPLVENAIKHGLEPQRGPGELTVSAAIDGATLVLAIADSGRGLEAAAIANAREPGPAGSGFGLAQIRERLRTLHGDAASFTLAPRAEGGTRAEIRLPLGDGVTHALAGAAPFPERPTPNTPTTPR